MSECFLFPERQQTPLTALLLFPLELLLSDTEQQQQFLERRSASSWLLDNTLVSFTQIPHVPGIGSFRSQHTSHGIPGRNLIQLTSTRVVVSELPS